VSSRAKRYTKCVPRIATPTSVCTEDRDPLPRHVCAEDCAHTWPRHVCAEDRDPWPRQRQQLARPDAKTRTRARGFIRRRTREERASLVPGAVAAVGRTAGAGDLIAPLSSGPIMILVEQESFRNCHRAHARRARVRVITVSPGVPDPIMPLSSDPVTELTVTHVVRYNRESLVRRPDLHVFT
jgi:hypothetical protein